MGKIAFIFAGQGAQKIGMGKELYNTFSVAKDVFSQASDSLRFDIADLIFNGDENTLQITENTQPCILTMSIAALKVLEEKNINASLAMGLSLGEYSANVCAGTFSFSDAVKLVKLRGKYMQEEVPEGIGAMAAIIGLSEDDVISLCDRVKHTGICEAANLNCPGQTVVSGEKEAVSELCKIAKETGAKRAMPLSVSAPFHCSMLKGAGEKLSIELDKIEINEPNISVISNVTADYVRRDTIKDILIKQVSSPVLWQKSMEKAINDGYDTFIEIGPGKALSGFAKKIDSNIKIFNVEDLQSLENTLEGLANA